MTAHRQAAGRKPLGELLLEEGWAAKGDIAQALADQADLEERLASLLVRRGLLDPDHAARALGRQHGVPAALVRHLAGRDRALAATLSPEQAHACSALPLAIGRDGSAVVCVRDPDRPDVLAALERAFAKRVTLVVACDHTLAPLLREVYGPPPEVAHDAFDIDVSFGEDGQGAAFGGHGGVGDAGFDAFGALSSGSFTLANLDDERVFRDPSQMSPPVGRDLDQPTWVPSGMSGMSSAIGRATPPAGMPALPRTPTSPNGLPALPRTTTPLPTPPPQPAIARTATPLPTPPPQPAIARTATPRPSLSTSLSSSMPPSPPPTLPSAPPAASTASTPSISAAELCARASAAMAQAQERDRLLDALFAALAELWSSAVLFTVKDSAALGQRGFGGQLSPHAVETLVVPLQSPSLLRFAWQRRELASGDVAGAVQERLLRQLGGGPAYAAPVEIAGRIVALVLAAAPRDDRAPTALIPLAKDLGTHLGRLIRATKIVS